MRQPDISYWSVPEVEYKHPPGASSKQPNISVEVINDATQMFALEEEWDQLVLNSSATIFQAFDWQYLWWKHFANHSEHHLFVILFRYNGRLIGIAPFFIQSYLFRHFRFFRRLMFLGAGLQKSGSPVLSLGKRGPCDYLDIIIKNGWEETIAETLVSFIGRTSHLWDEISLQNIREDGTFLNYVLPVLAGHHYTIEKKISTRCHRIVLPDSLDKYLSTLPITVKENYLNARDTYLRDPDCSIEDLCKKGTISGGLQSLSHLHEKAWNDIGYPGFFSDKRFDVFQRELAEALAEKKWLWFKKLCYKGKNVASHFGFRFKGLAYSYLSDIDKKRSVISSDNSDVRTIIHISMIEEAIKSDCKELDLGYRELTNKPQPSKDIIKTFDIRVRAPKNVLPNHKKRQGSKFLLHKIFSFIRRLNFRIKYETTVAKLIGREKSNSRTAWRYFRHLMRRASAEQKTERYSNRPKRTSNHVRSGEDIPTIGKLNGKIPCLIPTVTSGLNLSTEQITNHEGVYHLSNDWNRMEASACNPLLTIDWFISGIQTFCPPDNIQMIATKCEDKLKAVAPLSLRGKFLPVLELVGSSILEEPGGFLYEDQASLAEMIHTMLDLNKPLYLRGIRFFSPEARILEKELKTRQTISLVKEEKIPWVAISGTWEHFEKQMSSSRRSSLRRLQRLAEKKGEVDFKVITPSPENLDEYLEEVFKVEALNWKGKIGTSIKSQPDLRKFFTLYSQRTSKQNKLCLFFLTINEKTVAVQLAVVHANRLWIYKIGHDENWSYCSPGILLMHKVIRYCFEQDLTACEFLGSDESWLHIWANGFHSLATYRIYPRSMQGIVGFLWDMTQSYSYGFSKLLYRKMTRNISLGLRVKTEPNAEENQT